MFRYGRFESAHIGFPKTYSRTSDSTEVQNLQICDLIYYTTFKTIWHNECSYTLKYLETTFPQEMNNYTLGDSINVTIKEVLSNKKIVITSNYKGDIKSDTLIKIE